MRTRALSFLRGSLGPSLLSSALALTFVAAAAVGCQKSAESAPPASAGTQANAEPADDAPIIDPPAPPKASGNPIKSVKLWVDPDSLAALRAKTLRKDSPDKAALLDKIAREPQALWLGEWNSNIYRTVRHVVGKAQEQGAVPVLIAYNVPGRDCGQHSAGGLKSDEDYRRWIRKAAAGVGDGAAVFILEPDAIPLLDKCLSPEQQEQRMALVKDAVRVLRQNPKTIVYIDAGHARWQPPEVIAERLKKAGIEDAHGFALNTSNYVSTEENLEYGKKVSALVGGAHFVIDTSRNGAGPADKDEWCNPPGRKIGKPPSTDTGDEVADAFLWLKRPGESDGECNGGPRAGAFWDERAFELVQ